MLGDSVQQALETIGITQQRVKDWLGDCCCEERKEKLNQLDTACRRVLKSKIDEARKYLIQLLEQE